MFFRTCNPNTFIARYCYVKRVSKSVVGHPAIQKQHSQTFANLCRCSPIFPLILKNQTGMFPCHRSHYLQRHIVPVFSLDLGEGFPNCKWKKNGHLLNIVFSTNFWGLHTLLHAAGGLSESANFDTQKSDPNNLLCLTMGSAWTVVSLNLLGSGTNSKTHKCRQQTHRWGSSQGRPDAVLAFRTKVTGGLDIVGFMALEDSKDGAWRTRTVEPWWKWYGCFLKNGGTPKTPQNDHF